MAPHRGCRHLPLSNLPRQPFRPPPIRSPCHSPNIITPAGRLLPDGYLWRVAGYDDAGRLIRTSQSYELYVQGLDTHLLTIGVPASDTMISTDGVIIKGAVRGRYPLSCNGHAVPLDDDGNFADEIALHRGKNLLVYAVGAPDGVQRVLTRVVYQDVNPLGTALHVSED